MITLYHRDTTVPRSAPCDVADAPVFADDGKPAGFIGAAWGEHVPEDVIRWHVCEPDEVDAVLAGWGLTRLTSSPMGGDK